MFILSPSNNTTIDSLDNLSIHTPSQVKPSISCCQKQLFISIHLNQLPCKLSYNVSPLTISISTGASRASLLLPPTQVLARHTLQYGLYTRNVTHDLLWVLIGFPILVLYSTLALPYRPSTIQYFLFFASSLFSFLLHHDLWPKNAILSSSWCLSFLTSYFSCESNFNIAFLCFSSFSPVFFLEKTFSSASLLLCV